MTILQSHIFQYILGISISFLILIILVLVYWYPSYDCNDEKYKEICKINEIGSGAIIPPPILRKNILTNKYHKSNGRNRIGINIMKIFFGISTIICSVLLFYEMKERTNENSSY